MIKINKKNKIKKTSFLSMIMMISFFIMLNPISNSDGYSVFVFEEEIETLVVEDLIMGNSYNFTLTYETFFYTFDVGFSIYQDDDYSNDSLVLTQDEVGTGFEEAVYVAPFSGDFYISVWINDIPGLDDDGLVDILVIEQGSGYEMDIKYHYPRTDYDLRWVWIFTGVACGIGVLTVIFIIVLTSIAFKKQKARVAEAREKGYALPRSGIRKDKCPFCGVKLPLESIVTCPYCNAPITDE